MTTFLLHSYIEDGFVLKSDVYKISSLYYKPDLLVASDYNMRFDFGEILK